MKNIRKKRGSEISKLFAVARSFNFLICVITLIFLSGCEGKNVSKEDAMQSKIVALEKMSENQKNMKPVRLLFVGDMMFDRYIRQSVEKRGGDYGYVFSGIGPILAKYDLIVANLEGPITEKKSISVGTAMDERDNLKFTFDPRVVQTLAAENIRLVNLGNNHILNQEKKGLAETEMYLSRAKIQYFGDTGTDTPPVIEKNIGGTRIGFVNYNFSIPGSFERSVEAIKEFKKNPGVLVVYPHWGTEYKTGDPGRNVRQMAQLFVNAGADAVIGTHPHVVEMSEEYKGKKIYYSLGNFVFDQYFQRETMEGLGVELTLFQNKLEYNELKIVMNRRGQTEIIANHKKE